MTPTNGTLTIDQKAASVTPNSATKEYGDIDPALTGTLIGFLPVDGVTALYSRAAGETVLGGPYTISATLSPTGVLSNYDITYNTADFTITPAPLTITADDQTKTAGTEFLFDGTEFTASGMKFGEEVTRVTLMSDGAPAGAPVGLYDIIPSAPVIEGGNEVLKPSISNYEVIPVNGTMTVLAPPPAPVTATEPLPVFVSDELRFKIPRLEVTDNYQISATQGPIVFSANQAYFYHPIFEMNMYEMPAMGTDMYSFIDGNLTGPNPALLPALLDQEKKDAVAV